ncbi:MAG: WD40/YVTN/BNR-like repeat-containing protein, partial [Geminicoccaceae bacterium]
MTGASLTGVEPSRRGLFRRLVDGDPHDPRRRPWQQVGGLAAGPGDVFWTAWASECDVFVAGDEGAIFHFDGDVWERLAAPAPVPVHAIFGPSHDRLHAVGWMGAIIAYDGKNWRKERGCVIGDDGKYAAVEENTPLFDLTGDEDGRLWAVGDDGTILACKEGEWHREESGTRAHLRAIVRLPDGSLVAAGNDGAVLTSAGDGTWITLDCPVRSGFQALLPLGDDELLLAGGRYFIDANGFRGDLLRWRDGQFEKIETDEPLPRLRDLASYRDGALAVGDQGRIYFIRGNRIDRLESATRHDLMGIAPLPTGEALAVGDFGTVLTAEANLHEVLATPASISGEDTPSWEGLQSTVDRQLWGLWSDERDGSLYACGEEGTVLRFDGERFECLPPVGGFGVHCLTAASDGGLLAAGQLGEIHHFDGERWRKQFDLHVDITILSFWAETPEKIFAVGDEGLVLHWDGETWQRMTSGTRSALYGLWGMDAEHLLAVGD